MLVLYIFILMFTNSINHLKKNIHSTYVNRITIITLTLSTLFTLNTLNFQSIGKGISLYSGLFQITVQSHIVEILLLIVGISILYSWPSLSRSGFLSLAPGINSKQERAQGSLANTQEQSDSPSKAPKISNSTDSVPSICTVEVLNIQKSDQYSLIAIFSILGGSLLMSSLDLLSMYLSIELQSFALYILAALNKDKLSATSAGLKYFLLGSLSSCFILLGVGLIYSSTGLTQFEAIQTLISNSVSSGPVLEIEAIEVDINKAFTIGLIIMLIGFLFKISAAPFYQWAPDVYDGVPTIVTVWLTIVVKLTILIFLLSLFEVGTIQVKNLLLISSLLSLLIGTIAGLSQIKVKRLLAFSSISHVGFLLLALSIFTQKSVDSFIFYLVQYSITSLNIFLILLAFGYFIFTSTSKNDSSVLFRPGAEKEAQEPLTPDTDINYLVELKGQLYTNPVLSISLAICLFSMAGIPPLIGFFSKQFVLFSSIENGNYFLSIVAILVSVISASYYLKLIKITFFDVLNTKETSTVLGAELDKPLSLLFSAGQAQSERVSSQALPRVIVNVSNMHSYLISILTMLILFFFIDPTILLNGTQLISLTIFNI